MSNNAVVFKARRQGLSTTVQRTVTGDTRIHLSGLRDYLRAAGLPVLTELAAGVARAIGPRQQIHTACAMWCAQQVAWSHGGSIAA